MCVELSVTSDLSLRVPRGSATDRTCDACTFRAIRTAWSTMNFVGPKDPRSNQYSQRGVGRGDTHTSRRRGLRGPVNIQRRRP